MKKELRHNLASLREGRFTADPSWVENNKASLMNRISQDQQQTEFETVPLWRYLVPARITMAARPLASLVLAVIVSVIGWSASVSASYQSLPGDLLYNVKIATERTQIAIAGVVQGSDQKAKLLNTAAKNRAYETKVLISQNKSQYVEKTLASLEETVDEAKKTADVAAQREPEKAPVLLTEMSESNKEINKTLGEALGALPDSDRQTAEKVAETKKNVANKNIETAKEVITKKGTGGLGTVSDQDVEKLVLNVLETVEENLAGDKLVVEKLLVKQSASSSMAVLSTTTSIAVETTTSTSSTISVVSGGASSTPQVVVTINPDEVAEATGAAVDDLEDAHELASQGRLTEALDKVLRATEISNELVKKVVRGEDGGEASEESPTTTPPVVPEEIPTTTTSTVPVTESTSSPSQ